MLSTESPESMKTLNELNISIMWYILDFVQCFNCLVYEEILWKFSLYADLENVLSQYKQIYCNFSIIGLYIIFTCFMLCY